MGRARAIWYQKPMDISVVRFYDQLAENYHLIYSNWKEGGVPRQGEALDKLIRATIGPPPLGVLDCSCGIGTQAIGLALRGYQVRGSDLSSRAVERARKEARAFDVDVDFSVADMRDLETQIEGTYDVVLSCDNSLPHLQTDDDILLAARNMWSK